eukprot:scaffold670254_cov37-Prasinocladus_malaysianus.AAC.1
MHKKRANGQVVRDNSLPMTNGIESEYTVFLFLVLQEGNMWFDHTSFWRSHRSKRARRLISRMRGSQIYEVFIRERLRLAAD